MDKNNFVVCVHCATFNHASYIVDAMNGFTMQETSFPYVCCIIDDASTDGEPEVIRKYLQDNFDLEDKSVVRNDETDDYVLCFARHKTNKNCFFAVFWLKYNHYSIKKTKRVYLDEWDSNSKYIALCEGDDYWIVQDKLEKQIEFLEQHKDYTMVCNKTKLLSVRQNKYIGENYCYNKSRTVDAEDVINRTGLFISTCSIVYRKSVKDNYPEYCVKCKVGDYPLQIMCAMKGKVYYYNETMSVYRVENTNSWVGNQEKLAHNSISFMERVKSQIEMFKGFGADFPKFQKVFSNKVAHHIMMQVPYNDQEVINSYNDFFSDEIRKFSYKWKIAWLFKKNRVPILSKLYCKILFIPYKRRTIYY